MMRKVILEPHEDAQWGEAFQVQQMQQSLHGQEKSRKTFQNSHDLDQIVKLFSFLFEINNNRNLLQLF